MAVYCGTCAQRISSAPENGGSFQTTGEDFGGWSRAGSIHDTCESCADVLRAAVTKAARTIAKRNQKRVTTLKKEIDGYFDNAKRVEKEKEAFEQEWQERKRKLGLRL